MTEVLPPELTFQDIRQKEQVIVRKEQRQVLPQNGVSFTMPFNGSGPVIIFRIPNDENCSIDFSSAYICCDVQVTGIDTAITTVGAGNNTVTGSGINMNLVYGLLALPDNLTSLIQRIAIYCNGSELERCDYVSQCDNFINQHSISNSFQNSLGSGGCHSNLDILDRSKLLLAGLANQATSSNTIQGIINLKNMGLMNLMSLVPAYLLGNSQALEFRIYLDNAANNLIAGTFPSQTANTGVYTPASWTPSTATTFNITLSNVRMNLDYCQTTNEYSSSLREYLTQNQLTLPINTYYETVFSLSQSAGWQNFTLSTAFSDIEAVYIFFTRAIESGTVQYSSDRMWYPEYLQSARLSVNGVLHPNVPITFDTTNVVSVAGYVDALRGSYGGISGESYQYLVKSLGQNTSLEVTSQNNQNMIASNHIAFTNGTLSPVVYSTRSGSGLFYANNKQIFNCLQTAATPTFSGQSNPLINQEIFFKSPSSFAIGWDLTKSSYADPYALVGSDMTKSSGIIQVQLQFSSAPLYAYNVYCMVKHKRILDIGLDSSTIVV